MAADWNFLYFFIYPVRKSIQTEFAHVGGQSGLQFQVNAVAYCGE